MVTKTAAIGGGVIGGGWIARFLLNGHDVAVFDPHPDAERLVGAVLANAEHAYRKLTLAPVAAEGQTHLRQHAWPKPCAMPTISRKACRNGSISS